MSFASFVQEADELVVQPRMGFGDPARMRTGLAATRDARGRTVGTITLDSYTRVGQLARAHRAWSAGEDLNGYPLLTHPRAVTAGVLSGVRHAQDFPVQVRHGSALPLAITRAVLDAGLDATEGGPVSYCLPYSRVPLPVALEEWTRAVELFAEREGTHLESFGGCMLGQLCPPSLLVALSVLECMFFVRHGMGSVSLSYAQQTHPGQDREALAAVRRLARERLGGADWHVVLYAYMGVYPGTAGGARDLLASAARLARTGGARRVLVKTAAESRRIPTIGENVAALEQAARTAAHCVPEVDSDDDSEVYTEARQLVDAVLELDADPGVAMVRAFASGLLDVPFCLHPDNAGEVRCAVDPATGRLHWTRLGRLPFAGDRWTPDVQLTSSELLRGLRYVADRHDRAYVSAG